MQFVKSENTYDPTKYVRGGELIKKVNPIDQSKQEVKPRSKSSIIDRAPQNYTVKSNEVSEFDQIENKFGNFERKYTIPSKQEVIRNVQEENEETQMAEKIQNPYAQINLNSNISFTKNKYQQEQMPSRNKKITRTNQIPQNNDNNINNFDFNNFSRSSLQNNNLNNFDINQSNNQNLGNSKNSIPSSNSNQNNSINNNFSQGLNFNYQVKNNNSNNFDFGLMDLTNSNNFQQNYNNVKNAANFYQNNQSAINSMGQNAINVNNNLNNYGISTGIPTTNLKFPTTNNQNKTSQKNDDIFKDFFR